MKMRSWSCLVFVGALAGCSGTTINAGSNEGGASGGGSGGGASGSGPVSIASQIQYTPTNMASDGTSLFWVSSLPGAPLSRIPVGGGTPTTVLGPLMSESGFLAVDAVNVYYFGNSHPGLYRLPKSGGGSPSLISDADTQGGSAVVVGTTAYWVDSPTTPGSGTVVVKSAPVEGGAALVIAQFSGSSSPVGFTIGVTSTTVFLSGFGSPLVSFPLSSGIPDGGSPAVVPGVTQACQAMFSDTDAVYCDTGLSVMRIASDGTTALLGTEVNAGGRNGSRVAFDDTYVYWVDATTVGTIMRVPKTGGTATVIARDTSPLAIAVDAKAIYWSDLGGNIMRLAK